MSRRSAWLRPGRPQKHRLRAQSQPGTEKEAAMAGAPAAYGTAPKANCTCAATLKGAPAQRRCAGSPAAEDEPTYEVVARPRPPRWPGTTSAGLWRARQDDAMRRVVGCLQAAVRPLG